MYNRKVFVILLIGLCLFLATGIFPQVVEAAPIYDRQRITFQYQKNQTINPGKTWVDQDGLHIRQRIDIGYISGDLNGLALVEYNADMAPTLNEGATGPTPTTGEAYGTIQIFEMDNGLIPVTWEGRWSHTVIHSGAIDGELTALNPDRRQFIKMDQVQVNQDGAILYEGYLDVMLCYGKKWCLAMA